MTEDIELFKNRLVKNSNCSAQPKFPNKFIEKLISTGVKRYRI